MTCLCRRFSIKVDGATKDGYDSKDDSSPPLDLCPLLREPTSELLSSKLLSSSLVHYATMASATTIQPVGPVCTLGSHAFPKHSRPSKAEIQSRTNDFSPTKWSHLLRTGFQAMKEYTHRTYEEQSSSLPAEVVEYGLFAPRRKHAGEKKTKMALQTAKLLYPAPEDAELSQIIKYGERAPRDRII